jgi:Helix-turn-helix domain
MSQPVQEFWTAAETATILRRSVDSVRRDAKNGRLPAHRVNERGKLLFDPAEVRAALAGNASSKDQAPGVAV